MTIATGNMLDRLAWLAFECLALCIGALVGLPFLLILFTPFIIAW